MNVLCNFYCINFYSLFLDSQNITCLMCSVNISNFERVKLTKITESYSDNVTYSFKIVKHVVAYVYVLQYCASLQHVYNIIKAVQAVEGTHLVADVLIRGAFNKFPDFFVQAFKIVIDSWKFSILLLYILWDDWPIFMISGSKEQLQQQLEYTLLKPDCHSWWISKMQSDTLEEWYAIKFCFKLGKNATELYGMLQTAFRPSCMNRASVFEWHKRFKEGKESMRDDERCGRSKEVNTTELIGQTVRVRVTMLKF